jgi:TolB-like protein/DNA-binding winged helix-turn-helix (wHTH) protein/Flp pilus assembly protein TadD
MTTQTARTFRSGTIEVRGQELRATRNGEPLSIEPKAFQVLLYLLQHAGHLVTKNELLNAVWGDTAVTDNSLTRAIAQLRRMLDDDAHQPRFIETVATAGYRFISPVETIEDSAADFRIKGSDSSEGSIPSLGKGKNGVRSSHRVRWITGAATGLLVGLAATLLGLNILGLRDKLVASVHSAGNQASPQIKSLAVLPFEDVSSGTNQEYFADGMTEELITSLASIRDIRVISRASVMQFKGTRKSLPEIAHELNVDGIIEGTVARSGRHVRITANLLDAPTDRHVWANSYETDMEDLLVTQNKVAHSIADALRIELAPQSSIALDHPRRVSPEAYDAYLQGRYYMSKWNEVGFEKAAASFRQSIDIDPTYAPAYDGLADLYSWQAFWGLRPATDVFPLAKAAALKALELDDGLGDAHATLGMIKLAFDWDWPGAGKEFERAVQLTPMSSVVHFSYSVFLTAVGRLDEAVNEARKAVELDPLNPAANVQLGWVLYFACRHDEAIAQLKRALELDPSFASAYMELGWNYVQKRMYSEAVLACQKAVNLEPDEQVTVGSCGMVYGLAGRRKDALQLLARLKKVPERSYLDPYNVMALYVGLGDHDSAIHWLERAYREHSASIYGLKTDPFVNPMRSDPRFQDLLHRMNLSTGE